MATVKSYFFYVLYTADGYFYAGFTDDVMRRFATHKARKGAKFTKVKSRHPLQLIYFEAFDTKTLALQAEYAFKQFTRLQKEAFLIAHGVDAKKWS